ncbi:cytochrome P450 9e2-like [Neocloeon triangulifer]|uniref:cytochrome P450 9e2-like n=1 Tax=Neocloeon triangulifer TaxID=2078957 RepID=UPI00286F9A58|nr:cytochrome P450 9e2-like [Neocloeon triangulifer]
MWILTLSLVTIVFFLIYRWLTSVNNYWRDKGIPFVKPVPIFGSMFPIVAGKKSFADLLEVQYAEIKASGKGYGGIYEFMTPTIMVVDPEIIRKVTVKDFEHFAERRTPDMADDTDPLFHRSLVSLRSDEWKEMRNILSPAFTTSKLRGMFPLVSKCSREFAKSLEKYAESGEPVEMNKLFNRMANDVIGSVAFGHESRAIEDEKDEFFIMGQRLKNFSGLRYFIVVGYMLFPKLMKLLGISFTPKDISVYFRRLIIGTMEMRDKFDLSRPDMLQLLMAAQKGGIKREEGDEFDTGTVGEDLNANSEHQRVFSAPKTDWNIRRNITDVDIAAQAFIFFLAGYDTVSSVLSFAAHLLACHPEVQEKLLAEIKIQNEVTYDSIRSMRYLDMILSETLRLYPPAVFSDRKCTKNYNFPDSDFVMQKGQGIVFPIYALHRDPEYFANPDKFDPERFNDENRSSIRPYTYLPFGSGPHNCIGMRFALLEAKVCLVHLVENFELQVCSKTEIPLRLSTKTFQMITDNGFWLNLRPRGK